MMEFTPWKKEKHFRDRKRRYSTARRDQMEEKAKDQSASVDGAVYGKEIKAHIEEKVARVHCAFPGKLDSKE